MQRPYRTCLSIEERFAMPKRRQKTGTFVATMRFLFFQRATTTFLTAVLMIAAMFVAAPVASAACGDGVLDTGATPPEQCDDTNTTAGDGCDGVCILEAGWTCDNDPMPSVCCKDFTQAFGITLGSDNNVWFTSVSESKVGKITTGGQTTLYDSSATYPWDITPGPSGYLWYTGQGSENKVPKITTDGSVSLGTNNIVAPFYVTSDASGNAWFTQTSGLIGKLTSADVYTSYSIPTIGSTPHGITIGPDDNIWFAEFGTNKIGKMTTSGTFTEYTITGISSGGPHMIVTGPDGNLWFTLFNDIKVGKITTSGTITLYDSATGMSDIVVGSDSNLWLTNPAATTSIYKLTTGGTFTQYAITEGSGPMNNTLGYDGKVWFTMNDGKHIGKMATDGSYTLYQRCSRSSDTTPDAPGTPNLYVDDDSGTSSTDDNTSDTTPRFTVSCTTGDTVQLYSDSVSTGSSGTCASSTVTLTTGTLSDGSHSITAKQTLSSQTSAASSALSVTIDSTAPTGTGTPDMTAATDSGSSSTDNNTSNTTPQFTVSCTTGNTVQLYNDGSSSGSSGTCASSTVTLTSGTLTAGATYSITAKETDTAGNTSSASSALSVTVDTSAAAPGTPDLKADDDSGTSSTDNDTSDSTPRFDLTCETSATVTLKQGSTTLGTGTCSASAVTITSSSLSDGTYSVFALQTDLAGNISSNSSTLSVTIDTTAPDAPGTPDLTAASDTGSSASDDITADTTPTFDISCVSGTTVALINAADESSLGTGTCASSTVAITSSGLDENTYSLKAKQTDTAGNVSSLSSGLSVVISTANCGNGALNPGEECDDGNTTSSDGCSSVCSREYCGDGTTQTGIGEQCDDANTDDNDGCKNTCVIRSKAGAVTPESPAAAAKASSAFVFSSSAVSSVNINCILAKVPAPVLTQTSLLMKVINAALGAIGITPTAPTTTTTWVCETPPVCGDGRREGAEDCDDGNVTTGDGCTATCLPEFGWQCMPGGGAATSSASSVLVPIAAPAFSVSSSAFVPSSSTSAAMSNSSR